MPRQHANYEVLFTVVNDEERVDHWATLQKKQNQISSLLGVSTQKWDQFSVDSLATWLDGNVLSFLNLSAKNF